MIFCIAGLVFGIIFTPKDKNSNRQNGTAVKQTLIIVQNTIVQRNEYSGNSKNKSTNNDTDSTIGLIVGGVILAAIIYAKYHQLIIEIFTGLTIFTIASTITIALKLYKNNNYDRLNQWWTILMTFIVICNIVTIIFMLKQQVNLDDGIQALARVTYYMGGLAYMVIANAFLLVLTAHLYALNSYMAREGAISKFFIKKTSLFVQSPKTVFGVAIVLCFIGLLLSSGSVYSFATKMQETNINNILNTSSN